jgi:holo-[acyl-carrier protein] synthase
MATRVGIDLVFADTVRASLDAHGDSYLERVYSPRELADCRSGATVDPDRLAARFAAKEATFKVLRVGDEAVAWRDVEVQRDPAGWVTLSLSGSAAELARRQRIHGLSLSLTHERGAAAAVVIAEIDEIADT